MRKGIHVVECRPLPQQFAGPAVHFGHPVADYEGAAAGRIEVVLIRVVVVDLARRGGEDQEIAVGHLLRLMVQSGGIHGDGASGRPLWPPGRIPLVDGVAQHVDFEGVEVPAVEDQVAVAEPVDALQEAVRPVVPAHFVVGIQRDDDSPRETEVHHLLRPLVVPPPGYPMHGKQQHARLAATAVVAVDADAMGKVVAARQGGRAVVQRRGRRHFGTGFSDQRHAKLVVAVRAHAENGQSLGRRLLGAELHAPPAIRIANVNPGTAGCAGPETDYRGQRHAGIGIFDDRRLRQKAHEHGPFSVRPTPITSTSITPATSSTNRWKRSEILPASFLADPRPDAYRAVRRAGMDWMVRTMPGPPQSGSSTSNSMEATRSSRTRSAISPSSMAR